MHTIQRSFNTWNYAHCTLKDDLFSILHHAKSCGYTHVELSYDNLKKLDFERKTLNKLKNILPISSLHVRADNLMNPNLPSTCDLLETQDIILPMWMPSLGSVFAPLDVPSMYHSYLIVRRMDIFRMQSIKDTSKWVDDIQKIASAMHKKGLRLSFHNHLHEWIPFDGRHSMMDLLCKRTNPNELFFQLDIGHALLANVDLPTFIKKHKNRIVSFHLKDFRILRDQSRQIINEE